MVLRVVYKTSLLPLSVRSFSLNVIALLGFSCILLLGLRIITPFDPIHPNPYPARLISDRSFIALSADDFGRWADSVPLFPDSQFMQNHSHLLIQNDFWYKRATVETAADLRRLHHFLTDLNRNVSYEHRAVLTPHWIVGGPDFEAMRASGCDSSIPPTLATTSSVHTSQSPNSRQSSGVPHAHSESASLHPSVSLPTVTAVAVAAHNTANAAQTSAVHPSSTANSPHASELANSQGQNHSRRTTEQSSQSASASTVSTAESDSPVLPLSPRNESERPSAFETCQYREQLLSDAGPTGLDQPPYLRGDLKPHYKALWTSGLWHPEYHGRSHFSVSKWLRLLLTDRKAQQCFRNNLVCATDITQLRSEFNGFSDKGELKTWLEEGVNAFASFWGYRPALISSPHNTWSTWLADVVGDLSFIGAELAEDQATYVQHANSLSLHDRYRFDVFFPGFDCDTAIAEVVELLRMPVKASLADRWYQFLSLIDLFRTHRRPLHHGVAGDHRRFLSLMWHAQNAMGSTYNSKEHNEHLQCLRRVIDTVRRDSPRSVFVTGSELHQIRRQGWSREFWSDSIVLRNYGTHRVKLNVPDLRDVVPHGKSWRGVSVSSTVMSLNGKSVYQDRRRTAVGETIVLEADSVVRLTRG